MNRKFVKENKALVREFLGGLITKIVTGRAPAKFQKALDKNPKIQQHKIVYDAIGHHMGTTLHALMLTTKEQ